MKRNEKDRYQSPQGTIVLMIVLVVLLVALWGSAYLTMLARGATY